MGQIIAIAARKGGTGKTTTAINLSAAFAAMKRRVLLVDLDPQGNASVGCGISKERIQVTIGQLLTQPADVQEALLPTQGGFNLLPTGEDLIAAEMLLLQVPQREQPLKTMLAPLASQYDYIFIDCPPSLGLLTINALVAATAILIPIQCEYFALEGLKELLAAVEKIRRTIHPTLHLAGLLRTLYDGRNRLAQDISSQLLQHFKQAVYHTVIPRNVRLAEAPSYGLPILQYDEKSAGALAYLALAGEMLRRSETDTAPGEKRLAEITSLSETALTV